MSYNNVEVKVTVKVDGQRVGRRKITRELVGSLNDGYEVLGATQAAVGDLARELRDKVGV